VACQNSGLWREIAPRFVMMTALRGVLIANILGILGLVMGIIQGWVAYEASSILKSPGN